MSCCEAFDRRGHQNQSLPRAVAASALDSTKLCQPVEIAPSGPQWLHEIKLDGFRVSARVGGGRAQLLTRTGLDWSDKYPSVIAALAKLQVESAYLDGELCGIDDNGLPSFSQTQAASDGERGIGDGALVKFRSVVDAVRCAIEIQNGMV
jgi:ATP-dependent DNA ligase